MPVEKDWIDELLESDIKLAETIEQMFCQREDDARVYLDRGETLYLFHTRQIIRSVYSANCYAHSNQEFYETSHRENPDLAFALQRKNLSDVFALLLLPLTRGQNLIVDIHGDISVKCSRWGEKRVKPCDKHRSRFW